MRQIGCPVPKPARGSSTVLNVVRFFRGCQIHILRRGACAKRAKSTPLLSVYILAGQGRNLTNFPRFFRGGGAPPSAIATIRRLTRPHKSLACGRSAGRPGRCDFQSRPMSMARARAAPSGRCDFQSRPKPQPRFFPPRPWEGRAPSRPRRCAIGRSFSKIPCLARLPRGIFKAWQGSDHEVHG